MVTPTQKPIRRLMLSLCLLALTCSRSCIAFAPPSTTSRKTAMPPTTSHLPHARTPPRGLYTSASLASSTTHLAAAASPLTALASSPAGSLAILATIILVHEAGHYLAARSFRIRVEEFSIGIGPKLFGFSAFGGDEFNLRAFPVGGYVRFPENYNATTVRREEMAAMAAVNNFTEQALASNDQKILNALSLGTLGDQEIKKENERRAAAKAAFEALPWWKKVGKQPPVDDVIVGPDQVEIDYYDDPRLLQNRPWYERAVVLSGGIAFNFLLAFGIYFGIIHQGPGLRLPSFQPGIVVSQPPRSDAAANGILRAGDIILQSNGQAVGSKTDVSQVQEGISAFVRQIRATPTGESLELDIVRRESSSYNRLHVQITPKSTAAGGTIGVLLAPNQVPSDLMKSSQPWQAAQQAAQFTRFTIDQTASGLAAAFGGLFAGRSAPQFTGPIGLVKTGSEVVATKDWTAVLLFVAALSINLGVVNAIPLPALDGGQLVFVALEALTGRRVNQRVQESITGATFFLLLLITLNAAVGDVTNLFTGR